MPPIFTKDPSLYKQQVTMLDVSLLPFYSYEEQFMQQLRGQGQDRAAKDVPPKEPVKEMPPKAQSFPFNTREPLLSGMKLPVLFALPGFSHRNQSHFGTPHAKLPCSKGQFTATLSAIHCLTVHSV